MTIRDAPKLPGSVCSYEQLYLFTSSLYLFGGETAPAPPYKYDAVETCLRTLVLMCLWSAARAREWMEI